MSPDAPLALETGIDAALAAGDFDRAAELAGRYRATAADGTWGVRSPRWRAAWLSVQVAVAAGRLTEARRHLGRAIPIPTDVPPALRRRVLLAAAEVETRLGAPTARAAFAAARAVESPDENYLFAVREIRIALWLGDVDRVADEAAALADRLADDGDRAHAALLWCELGRAFDATGRLDRAADCWRRAEALAVDLGDDPIRGDVLVQLGRLAHLRGHLQTALDRYEAVAAGSAAAPQRLEARLRRLLVLLDLNQETEARFELARLKPLLHREPAEELAPLVAIVRTLLGEDAGPASGEAAAHRAARAGDLARARALYRQAHAEEQATARQARLAVALGTLALAAGDVAEARRWLAQAEAVARREDLPEVLWRALQARGQLAAEHDHNDDLARDLLEQAVVVTELQGSRLRHRLDAVTHGVRRGEVVGRLLAAACRRNDPAAVFHYQELQRGRLLLELWQTAGAAGRPATVGPALDQIDTELTQLEADAEPTEALVVRREQLHLLRQRLLDGHLRDRSRAGDAALPAIPELVDLQKTLSTDTVYVAAAPCGDELYLLVAPPDGAVRVVAAPAPLRVVAEQVAAFRRCLDGQLDRYRRGFPMGNAERRAIDARLADLGGGPLGDALWPAIERARRVLWVPDGVLHGVPVQALRRDGEYLIETHEVVQAFGGSLVVHQARQPGRRPWLRRAVVVTESADVLPAAAAEGEAVAATFLRRHTLHGAAATRATLRRLLPGATVAHLACHAYFDERHPLSSAVGLPSGEQWRAVDWLAEPLAGLPLVTLSACRSAEVGPLAGREVFGLVTGLLAAGVRAVVAGLWPIADREAGALMGRFYRALLEHDLPAALAAAQRETLARPDGSPLFWAAFGLFGDPHSLPYPSRWLRWLGRWRAARHARRFDEASFIPASGG